MAATVEIVIQEPGGAPAPPPPAPATPTPLPPAPPPVGYDPPPPVTPPGPPEKKPAPPADAPPTDPAYDKVPPPRATPVPPILGSRTPVFDRPSPVIVVGPRPLPVTIAGGMPGGGAPRPPGIPRPRPTVAQRAFEIAGAGARTGGAAATGAAGNAALPGLMQGLSTASAGLARLGPYGMAAAAALDLVKTSVTAFKNTVDAFVARGRELQGYSGRIAAATAGADVRRLGMELREADRLGPQYARLIEAQSKTEAIWSQILMLVKGPLMEMLTKALETANKTLVGILEGIDELTLGVVPGLKDLVKDVKKINAGDMPGDIDKLVNDWLNANTGVGAPAPLPALAVGAGVVFPDF